MYSALPSLLDNAPNFVVIKSSLTKILGSSTAINISENGQLLNNINITIFHIFRTLCCVYSSHIYTCTYTIVKQRALKAVEHIFYMSLNLWGVWNFFLEIDIQKWCGSRFCNIYKSSDSIISQLIWQTFFNPRMANLR